MKIYELMLSLVAVVHESDSIEHAATDSTSSLKPNHQD
jgi:hypothetical protein